MFSPFEEIDKNARVWIYQSSREFSEDDKNHMSTELRHFTDGWVAHGKEIKSSFLIAKNRFLVLAADESHNMATGCSIDSSVALVQKLGQELGINFFDRTSIPYMDGGIVKTIPLQQVPVAIENGEIKEETLTFNNLVKDISEFQSAWEVPAHKSWLKRYFKASVSQ